MMETKQENSLGNVDVWNGEQIIRIKVCKENDPEQILTVMLLKGSQGEDITIGLFKCMKCNMPTHHLQFNYGRLCGQCDMGKEKPKWIVEKPKAKVE